MVRIRIRTSKSDPDPNKSRSLPQQWVHLYTITGRGRIRNLVVDGYWYVINHFGIITLLTSNYRSGSGSGSKLDPFSEKSKYAQAPFFLNLERSFMFFTI